MPTVAEELVTVTTNGTSLKLHTGLFIKNEFIQGENNNTFETINPSSGKAICRVAEAFPSDVDYTIDTAVKCIQQSHLE